MHLGKDTKTRQSDESSTETLEGEWPWMVSFRREELVQTSSSRGEGHQREKCFFLPWEGAWSGAGKQDGRDMQGKILVASISQVRCDGLQLDSCQDRLFIWRPSSVLLTPFCPVEVHSLFGGLTALSNTEGSCTLSLPKFSLMPSIIVIWSCLPLCFQKWCRGDKLRGNGRILLRGNCVGEWTAKQHAFLWQDNNSISLKQSLSD